MNAPETHGSKPLYVTSTTHAMALWMYVVQFGCGVAYGFRLPNMEPLDPFFRHPLLVEFWALCWAVAGAVGFISSLAASHSKPPAVARRIRWWLLVEAGACGWLTLVLVLWMVAVYQAFGLPRAAITLLLGGGYLAAAVHRFVQIVRERPRLAAAIAHPTVAEVLAEPDTDRK